MKRFTILLLALACACGLTACGSVSRVEAAQTAEETETAEADPAKLGSPIPAESAFAGGSGTAEDPYQIATAGQLALLAEKVNEGDEAYREASYVLTADIALNDTADLDTWGEAAPAYQWTPIGDGSSTYARFGGSFDGCGHSISGLYCYMKALWYEDEGYSSEVIGLFGILEEAEVKNLTVTDSYLEGEGQLSGCGTIAAKVHGSRLENCESTATVIFGTCNNGVGGIAGDVKFDSALVNCTNRGTVRHVADGRNDTVEVCGGVAGYVSGSTVTGCANEGEVSGLGIVGGVIGQLQFVEHGETCLVADCRNSGAVTGAGSETGGVFGNVYNGYGALTLEACVNSGSVTAQGYVGGVCGLIRATQFPNADDDAGVLTLKDCVNEGAVSLTEAEDVYAGGIGGIAGYLSTADGASFSAQACENTGSVEAEEYVAGGLFGTVVLNYQGTMEVTACTNRGTVTSANGCYGGIMAMLTQAVDDEGERHIRIQDCVNEGNLSGRGWNAGGILGMATLLSWDSDSFEVVSCENRGEIRGVTDTSMLELGGIIGGMITTDGTLAVTDCTNRGNVVLQILGAEEGEHVSIPSIASGIVASYAENVQITGCESTGEIAIEGVSEEDADTWLAQQETCYPDGYVKSVYTMEEIEASVEEGL